MAQQQKENRRKKSPRMSVPMYRLREQERALLVRLNRPNEPSWHIENTMNELAELARTAGALVVGRVFQNRRQPDPAFYIGSGKAQEVAEKKEADNIDLVVFCDDLSPAQQRNLEDTIGGKVIDRTQLILDIFSQRAQTREGKLQVELAQLQYLLPRLRGMGEVLSRLGGGIGTRGPGETKLETDRRRIRSRIDSLKKKLEKIREQRGQRRKRRQETVLPLVSLVGYTNAGKSTLLSTLTGEEVFAEDKLFCTLDTTTRQVESEHSRPFLLTDTVGFVQSLPHHLVAAFRATLEETTHADALIHVVDVNHPRFEDQIEAVNEVLEQIDADDKPTITALNKIDLLESPEPRINSGVADKIPNPVHISALTGEGIPALLAELDDMLSESVRQVTVRIPFDDMDMVDLLHRQGRILEENYGSKGVQMIVEIPRQLTHRVKAYLQ